GQLVLAVGEQGQGVIRHGRHGERIIGERSCRTILAKTALLRAEIKWRRSAVGANELRTGKRTGRYQAALGKRRRTDRSRGMDPSRAAGRTGHQGYGFIPLRLGIEKCFRKVDV